MLLLNDFCSKTQACPRRSLEFSITQMSLQRLLYYDFGLEAHTVQLTQELKPADHQQYRFFADWVLEMHESYLEFHRKTF